MYLITDPSEREAIVLEIMSFCFIAIDAIGEERLTKYHEAIRATLLTWSSTTNKLSLKMLWSKVTGNRKWLRILLKVYLISAIISTVWIYIVLFHAIPHDPGDIPKFIAVVLFSTIVALLGYLLYYWFFSFVVWIAKQVTLMSIMVAVFLLHKFRFKGVMFLIGTGMFVISKGISLHLA
jgi:hypothetical protein